MKLLQELELQKFDPFLLKIEIHFEKQFIAIKGHNDSATIFTYIFVDEYQSQGNIFFKKYRTEDLLVARKEIVSSYLYYCF